MTVADRVVRVQIPEYAPLTLPSCSTGVPNLKSLRYLVGLRLKPRTRAVGLGDAADEITRGAKSKQRRSSRRIAQPGYLSRPHFEVGLPFGSRCFCGSFT